MYIRKEREHCEGYVDPSTQFSESQLNDFWDSVQRGSTNIDKPIDNYLYKKTPVTILEILGDAKYDNVRWKLHQPVCPCCLTTFNNYLINIQYWFNEGRLAWYALALLAELDVKIFRENHLGGIAGELHNIAQRLENYLKDAPEKLKDEVYVAVKYAHKSLKEYSTFLNDIINGRIINYNYFEQCIGTSLPAIELEMRHNLVNHLETLVCAANYNFLDDLGEDLVEEFLKDTSATDEPDGSALLNFISEHDYQDELPVPYVIRDKGIDEDVEVS